jgi:CRISPR-associated protein Cas1
MALDLNSLTWRRLPVTLINTRISPAAKAHPVLVFQAIVKGVTTAIGPEDPSIFFTIQDRRHAGKIPEGDRVGLFILFCGHDEAYLERWTTALRDYLADPETGRNFQVCEIGKVEERSLSKIIDERGMPESEGEICLEFLTPVPFKTEKNKPRTHISRETLIKAVTERLSRLFGRKLEYRSEGDDFSVLPQYWNYTEHRHASLSQSGTTQYIKGCVGKLYIKGKFADFLPYLLIAGELHAGSRVPAGQGQFLLHDKAPGYFQRFFPNRKGILASVRDVLHRYDNALESLSLTESYPFREEEFADSLLRQLVDGSYQPSPCTAFEVRKKDGTERIVERLGFRDLIVQQYVLGLLSKPFDLLFEECSLGFRKGYSRQKARDMVRSAVDDGYQYVVESDIEDFFPSIDHHRLERLLDFYLPSGDSALKELLLKCTRSGYVLNGSFHDRTRGLAQGAPLSPILTNLYLDSFDEEIRTCDVRMIRYADDFVILTRTREEAEAILEKSERLLCGIGLKIGKEKTAIRNIREGFRFLGIRFERSEAEESPEEEYRRLKKPLYVTEPDLFLSINGDALDILRKTALVETIPLRRISEIMVMERSVFSTAVIRKCTDNDIPLTILLNSGYFVTTIKPDSRRYYDVSFQHSRKHYSFSETELLCVAKEFAAHKLLNYIALFRQRYVKELGPFIGELERVVQRIYQAPDVEHVRGFEGGAAKKIYQQLNRIIDEEVFHMRKRDRRNPDRINSMFNFGYYLLFSRINATVRAVGLNPYLGFLHSAENDYESLVCDIQELFRARIDRFIIRLLNLKIITGTDFVESDKGHYLSHDAVKKYLNHFEAEMEKKNSKNELSLKESIYVQVNILKRHVLEDASLAFHVWEV